ncbi:MAG: dTDP-glucose 4,6-dehydratase [Chloroflexi bacterium]|nr:dTDP-glucose 4,6-dehydratase [Chloroflexota bacterium]
MRNLLVTGGAGFIGSNFARYILETHPDYRVVVLDKLTYAGNLDNLRDLEGTPRFTFVRGDICDAQAVDAVMRQHQVDTVVNFAAETHVDRSIMAPDAFIQTDVFGTYVLLEAARRYGIERYHQVSTDEIYGEVLEDRSLEDDPMRPRSPYSASKAGAEHLVASYHVTYGLPTTVTRGSNNIGPYQYPEKVVPLFITNAIDDLELPIYGDGQQMRDYQYVLDHCQGIDTVLHRGVPGQAYNLGSGVETVNLEMALLILELLGKPTSLLRHVSDRPGHDRRYALDCGKIQAIGWQPHHSFRQALEQTVDWYVRNEWWWRKLKSGEYRDYYRRQYVEREGQAKP